MPDFAHDPELRQALIKAVRHMEQEDEVGLHKLPTQLAIINNQLVDINSHLKSLNHRTEKNEVRITDTEKEIAGIKGTAKAIGWASGIASTLVVSSIMYAFGLKK